MLPTRLPRLPPEWTCRLAQRHRLTGRSAGTTLGATFGDRSVMIFAMRRAVLTLLVTLPLLLAAAEAQPSAGSSGPSSVGTLPPGSLSTAGGGATAGGLSTAGSLSTGRPVIPANVPGVSATPSEKPVTVSEPADSEVNSDSRGVNIDLLGQATNGQKSSNWLWSLTIRNRTGWRTARPRTWQMSRNYIEAKGVYRIDDTWSLTLEGRAHYDPVGRLGYPTRLWLDPRQALLDGRVGRVDLKLGLQQVVWGEADGLRVLDVINPLDYREFILEDFLDSRRPLWMARADLPVGDGSVQVIWIPYFATARIPTGRDEFSPGLGRSGESAFMTGGPPIATGFEVAPTVRPGDGLNNSQWGVRYRRTISSWDLTLNYFKGWEDLPTPYFAGVRSGPEIRPGTAARLLPSQVPAPVLLLAPRHERKEVIGGTATNSFGPVVARFEGGVNRGLPFAVRSERSADGFVKGSRLSGVAGLDYSIRPGLWISGQYFVQIDQVADDPTGSSRRALLSPRQSHLVSLYLRTSFRRETLRPELFVLRGLSERQYLVRPRLTKTLGDHWTISAGADLLGGASGNLFGYFQQRDRVVIELKWMK